jgi:hypothetical protein
MGIADALDTDTDTGSAARCGVVQDVLSLEAPVTLTVSQ